MKAIVDNKQLAGVATMVARHGQVVQSMVYGQQDIQSNTPLQKDTIVRIYSMTKPITGVAMMILYEEGQVEADGSDQPLHPRVQGPEGLQEPRCGRQAGCRCAGHPPTMGELMSHTAGFTYGLFGSSPVDKMYQPANVLAATSLKDFIDKVAPLPLVVRAGPGLDVQRQRRHPGLPGREAVGAAVRRLPARAHLRAARHERHGVLRAAEQAAAARERSTS
jgi:CubicO group peptidase (beta-lactamase class C family)